MKAIHACATILALTAMTVFSVAQAAGPGLTMQPTAWRAARIGAAPVRGELDEERLGQFLESAAQDGFTPGAVRSFVLELRVLDSEALAYDKDRKVMRIDFGKVARSRAPFLAWNSSAPVEFRERPVISLSGGASRSSVRAVEVRGTRNEVATFVADTRGIIPANLPFPADGPVVEVPMSAELASSLDAFGRWRIAGRLTGEGARSWVEILYATPDNPEERHLTHHVARVVIDRIELAHRNGTVYAAIGPAR